MPLHGRGARRGQLPPATRRFPPRVTAGGSTCGRRAVTHRCTRESGGLLELSAAVERRKPEQASAGRPSMASPSGQLSLRYRLTYSPVCIGVTRPAPFQSITGAVDRTYRCFGKLPICVVGVDWPHVDHDTLRCVDRSTTAGSTTADDRVSGSVEYKEDSGGPDPNNG